MGAFAAAQRRIHCAERLPQIGEVPSNQRRDRQMASEPMPRLPTQWWIEYENGDRSTDYDSEAEAWAAVVELDAASGPRSRPARLFSSDGQRFVIPVKGGSR